MVFGWSVPVVSSCDAIKLLLPGGVPEHQPDVLTVQTDNKRQTVRARQANIGRQQHIPEMFARLIITSSRQLSTHQIRFSRKSTPMVFLYSAVKIPLQYFWIIEDLPTAPLPTMTTWREFSKIIEMKHRESIYIWGNLGCERCWILRLLTWIVLYVWICWIHQKPFELSLTW